MQPSHNLAFRISFVEYATKLLKFDYRNVHDPRSLAIILHKAEVELASKLHPDPYIGALNYLLLSMRQSLIIVPYHFRTYDARWHEMVSLFDPLPVQ